MNINKDFLEIIKTTNPPLYQICQTIDKSGGECFLVGGALRDLLLGTFDSKKTIDVDFEVYSLDLNKFFVENNFFDLEINSHMGVFKINELYCSFSMPRREKVIGKSNKFNIEIDPWLTKEQATVRRDFTMNAILYNIFSGELIDVYNGISDLKAGQLKMVSPKFKEDPFRVFRLIRFVSEYGFQVDVETLLEAKKMFKNWKLCASKKLQNEISNTISGRYLKDALSIFEKIANKNYFSIERERLLSYNQFLWGSSKNSLLKNQEIDLVGFALVIKYLVVEDSNLKISQETLLFHLLYQKKKRILLSKLLEISLAKAGGFWNQEQVGIFNFFNDVSLKKEIKINYLFWLLKDKHPKEIEDLFKEHKQFVKKYEELFLLFKQLQEKYNGQYYLTKGFIGLEIKEEQIKQIVSILKGENSAEN